MSAEGGGRSARLARSALYVPGDAPDKLRSAMGRGADELIVDLEDAVALERKPLAREVVAAWLDSLPEGAGECAVWIRINPHGAERDADLAVLGGAGSVAGFVAAKTESRSELVALDEALTAVGSAARVVPLLESARAVLDAREIASGPRVSRVQIGEADLRADIGVSPGPDERELLLTRSAVVLASAAAGVDPPIAPVSTEFRDLTGLRASTEALARLGFVGRACIHPAQVTVVNEVFTPSADAVAEATEVLSALADAGSGVALDARGRMIDEAVARQARQVLARVR